MTGSSMQSFYDFELTTIDGQHQSLEAYRGKVVLVVNVASRCGFTQQYEGLQALYEKYQDHDLVVLGVPSNDFFGQEPGSNQDIQTFCETQFHVTFPMFGKLKVRGKGQAPLYQWLTTAGGGVTWNFNKFLIDRDGQVSAHFGSRAVPLGDELEAELIKLLETEPSTDQTAPRRGRL